MAARLCTTDRTATATERCVEWWRLIRWEGWMPLLPPRQTPHRMIHTCMGFPSLTVDPHTANTSGHTQWVRELRLVTFTPQTTAHVSSQEHLSFFLPSWARITTATLETPQTEVGQQSSILPSCGYPPRVRV